MDFLKLDKTFVENLHKIYSKEELETIKTGFSTPKRNTTFRVNRLRTSLLLVMKKLKENNIEVEEFSGISHSFRLLKLEDEKKLWDLDLIKRGHVYIQGISSQLPTQFFSYEEGMRVLDLSAAPGGKTSQIAEKLDNAGNIIALDNNAIRIDKLNFTLKRQGATNVEVIKSDARKYSDVHEGDLFDAMIFDAPCSAEGRVNLENEKTYSFISEANNKKNYKLQRDILKNNIKLLNVGGELIYSTCTISPLENEAVVHFLLCNFPELEICELDKSIFSTLKIKEGLTHYGETAYKKEVSKSIRILPSLETEGFFIAKFKKKAL